MDELAESIAQLWTLNPRHLRADALVQSCRAWLDAEESHTYKALERELKHEYLAAHALLRVVVGRFIGQSPAKVTLARRRFGKPRVSSSHTPAHFNLSHTADLAAVLISDVGPVGLDIERIDRPIDSEQIARHFGSPILQVQLAAVPSRRRNAWLYRQWVLHEALLKAVGIGLSERLPLRPLPLDIETAGGVYGNYQLQLFELNSTTVAGAAMRTPSPVPIEICEGERLFET